MDELFGSEAHVVTIPVKKKGSQKSNTLAPVNDYVVSQFGEETTKVLAA